MKVEIISIGSELIYGQIVNTNAAFLAKRLTEGGLDVRFHTAVGDNKDELIDSLHVATRRADLIILTGGLGPTKDDITREVIALFCGVDLILDEGVYKCIKEIFSRKRLKMPENNRLQALIPAGSTLIPNPLGTAPGFITDFRGKKIVALPGMPAEMKLMLEEGVIPYIKEELARSTLNSASISNAQGMFNLIRDINTFGEPESAIGKKIEHLMGQDKNPEVGTQAGTNGIIIRLYARGCSKEECLNIVNKTEHEIRSILGRTVFGIDEIRLEDAVAELLKRYKMTISLAESCTGGLVSNLLTDVSGISEYLIEGIVAYTEKAKINLLGVPEGVIKRFGAVSPEIASRMARAVRRLAGSDIGLGITGLAGPTGATPEKPIGLVYIAIDLKGDICCKEMIFSGNRIGIKRLAANACLNMLRLKLLELEKTEKRL